MLFAGIPIAFLAIGAVGVSYVDTIGENFFKNGKEILVRLEHLSKKLKAKDADRTRAVLFRTSTKAGGWG